MLIFGPVKISCTSSWRRQCRSDEALGDPGGAKAPARPLWRTISESNTLAMRAWPGLPAFVNTASRRITCSDLLLRRRHVPTESPILVSRQKPRPQGYYMLWTDAVCLRAICVRYLAEQLACHLCAIYIYCPTLRGGSYCRGSTSSLIVP